MKKNLCFIIFAMASNLYCSKKITVFNQEFITTSKAFSTFFEKTIYGEKANATEFISKLLSDVSKITDKTKSLSPSTVSPENQKKIIEVFADTIALEEGKKTVKDIHEHEIIAISKLAFALNLPKTIAQMIEYINRDQKIFKPDFYVPTIIEKRNYRPIDEIKHLSIIYNKNNEFITSDAENNLYYWKKNEKRHKKTFIGKAPAKITCLETIGASGAFIVLTKSDDLLHYYKQNDNYVLTKLRRLHNNSQVKGISFVENKKRRKEKDSNVDFVSYGKNRTIVYWKKEQNKYTGSLLENIHGTNTITDIKFFNNKDFISADDSGEITYWKKTTKGYQAQKLANKHHNMPIKHLLIIPNTINEFITVNSKGIFHWKKQNDQYITHQLDTSLFNATPDESFLSWVKYLRAFEGNSTSFISYGPSGLVLWNNKNGTYIGENISEKLTGYSVGYLGFPLISKKNDIFFDAKDFAIDLSYLRHDKKTNKYIYYTYDDPLRRVYVGESTHLFIRCQNYESFLSVYNKITEYQYDDTDSGITFNILLLWKPVRPMDFSKFKIYYQIAKKLSGKHKDILVFDNELTRSMYEALPEEDRLSIEAEITVTNKKSSWWSWAKKIAIFSAIGAGAYATYRYLKKAWKK